ncbi:MAG: MATE family efflux transporter [Lachnospiraceae bacterium]|nr:MATE family efflux transporter [Lachnospiraceae bacterium]
MNKDLTTGNVARTMLAFAGPMIVGNLLQQCYNIADTLIVGKYLGADALAAVGSAYTLMTFLTSILIGLCMGSGAVFSLQYGRRDLRSLRKSLVVSFGFTGGIAVVLSALALLLVDVILKVMQVPAEITGMMREYVWIVFWGIFFVFLYNFFAYLLRALGNSFVPLCFLGISAVLNIGLDLLFVMRFEWEIAGAAAATVAAQCFSGVGIGIYTWFHEKSLRPGRKQLRVERETVSEIVRFSTASCIQQSVMNFGILMIQGLVNSFGPAVMAAFAAAVKIDSFAYMPAQEFGNAFSLFISQNHGAGKGERVKEGTRAAIRISVLFCLIISAAVFVSAASLMQIFVRASETEIIAKGVCYLRIEGACYCGIGVLFLLYGYFRGIGKPEMSIVLTVISLGTRVLLAYLLAPIPPIGEIGIWCAIPIGWILADLTGVLCIRKESRQGG